MLENTDDLIAEIRRRVWDLGFEVVDVRPRGSRQRPLLQVRIDRPDSSPGHGVTVSDCAVVSRALEAWLDETRQLGAKYVLEVSSPGIERPVRWREHWMRYCGQDVHVKLASHGRIRATIVRVDDTSVSLRPQGAAVGEEVTVPLEEAREATLAVDWT
jgi:ribosome maturation factor RimP